MSEDGLPSLVRPTAWETPTRPRQLTSPHSSESGSSHHSIMDDPYSRTGSPSTWRSPGIGRDPGFQQPANLSNRRHILEAQEQLRMYKEELERKERLIAELMSIETPRTNRNLGILDADEILGVSGAEELSVARSQVAALQAKVDGLQSQLRELCSQLEARDSRIGELTAAQDAAKDAAQRQAALILSLRQRAAECEVRYGDIEGATRCKDHVISTLEKERSEEKQRIIELEIQSKVMADKIKLIKEQKNHLEQCFLSLAVKLNMSVEGGMPAADVVINKVEDLLAQRASQQCDLEARVDALRQELEMNRDNIARITTEKDELLAAANRHSEEHVKLHEERAESERRILQLQQEVERLNARARDAEHEHSDHHSRAEQMARDIEQLRAQLHNAEHACSSVERERDEFRSRAEHLEQEFEAKLQHHGSTTLLRNLIPLLANGDVMHDESENWNEAEVVDRVRHVMHALRDKSARIELLEHKVSDLTSELELRHQPPISSDALLQLERRLQRAEDELAAGDVLRDNLRADREKFLKFIEQMSRVLGMDAMSADVGLDDVTDAVITRAEQLMKNETTLLADRKSQVYNLQRKLKILKDQLDSKDVHMELLRKKNVSLEERLSSKSDLEREKDSETVRSRKLMKLAEKYKRELNELHAEVRDLRARLLHSTEIMAHNGELEHELERLRLEQHQLKRVQQEKETVIESLKEVVDSSSSEHGRKHDQASNTINALTSELRTTKQALEDVTKREQQLVDLRNVIARMLGLSLDTLAVPDFELVARLEQLILANQSNAATAIALDSAVAYRDLGEGFRAGYQEAARVAMMGRIPGTVAGMPGVSHRRRLETRLT